MMLRQALKGTACASKLQPGVVSISSMSVMLVSIER